MAATLEAVGVHATSVRSRTGRSSPARVVARWMLVSAALFAVVAALFGLAFAGSPARLAEGVSVAGVDVGGLTRAEARKVLERRFAEVAHVPVVFTAGRRALPDHGGGAQRRGRLERRARRSRP